MNRQEAWLTLILYSFLNLMAILTVILLSKAFLIGVRDSCIPIGFVGLSIFFWLSTQVIKESFEVLSKPTDSIIVQSGGVR